MAKNSFSSRTKARARAVDVLFEARQKDLDDPAGIWGLAQERQVISTAQTTIPPYAVQICEGVADHLERIDAALSTYSQGWPLDRMPELDLAILRVATWEILYNDQIDGPTAITEAMKIAREKSTDGSAKFINGLLGRINDLRDALVAADSESDLPAYSGAAPWEEPDFSSGLPAEVEGLQLRPEGEGSDDADAGSTLDTAAGDSASAVSDDVDSNLVAEPGHTDGEPVGTGEPRTETGAKPQLEGDVLAQIDLDNLSEDL